MIEKIINTVKIAESEADGLKRMAPLATQLGQLDDATVERLIGELSALATSADLTPLPDEQGQWKTRLDLLIPIVHALLVRSLKQAREAAVKNKKSEATAFANTDAEANKNAEATDGVWSGTMHQAIDTLYFATPPESELRCHLLRWLASSDTEPRLRHWVQLLTDQPPEHRSSIVLAFAPLMDASFSPPQWMLEDLLSDTTGYSQIASAVYDLCNFYFRNDCVEEHPAIDRLAELNPLMGQLCDNLLKIESGQVHPQIDRQVLNRQVSDSVALVVALCDTFALVGYEPALENIVNAMTLRHRRVQTEAAAALARLGRAEGRKALIAMAQDPVSRLRVLAYAEELNFKHEISLELQGEIAIAESRLAIWLSEPDQMGLAPSRIELRDTREMYWPSYEHPVVCYLFQFWYGSGDNALTNIGICGPMTHALSADLTPLPNDDVYALFAGWQTTHQEIFHLTVPQAEKFHASEIRRLNGVLTENEIEEMNVVTAASFFGELVLIATGQRDGQNGTAIADQQDITWVVESNAAAPIDWTLAFAMWRGRRLLSTFNQEDHVA